MRFRRLLFLLPLFLLNACANGGGSGRLASFLCEDLTPTSYEDRQSISMINAKLEAAESLAAFHSEELPWVYDKKTGDLYGYDEFEEAFVPLVRDEDGSSSTYKLWTEYAGNLSKNGEILKIKNVGKAKNGIMPEVVLYETLESYEIKSQKLKWKTTEDGVISNGEMACTNIPVDGIEVKLISKG